MVTDDDNDLQFCWDDGKAASNVEKHCVSFELATFLFHDPMRFERADVFAEGEYRSIMTGRVNDEILTVVCTAPEDDLYRVISARLATPSERDHYEQNLFHS